MSPCDQLTVERMAIRKTSSKEVHTFIDTLCGGRFVSKSCIYAMSKVVHLSATFIV